MALKTGEMINEKTGKRVFWGGIAFSILFTLLIGIAGQRLADIPLLPDQGLTWYFWKLPSPTFWSQVTAWGGYLLHQGFLWGLIYYGQKNIQHYAKGLHSINIIALAGNALFIGLHFLQTQFWYDGLAQNVPLESSEASVILLLVIVLIMENQRRGLFFGKKIPLGAAMMGFFRRNHGYIFAWAITYTFWFHPMVNTPGHLVGFFYIFLLLLQSSLFYTRYHLNRWWTMLLEFLVLAHGAMVVAMIRGTGVWAFILGFMGVFLLTQMHGLRLSIRMKWLMAGVYALTLLIAFSSRGSLVGRDIIFIPVIEYGLVLVIAILAGSGLWVIRSIKSLAQKTRTRQ